MAAPKKKAPKTALLKAMSKEKKLPKLGKPGGKDAGKTRVLKGKGVAPKAMTKARGVGHGIPRGDKALKSEIDIAAKKKSTKK